MSRYAKRRETAMMNSEEMRKLTLISARNASNYVKQRQSVVGAIENAALDGVCFVELRFLNVRNEAIIDELRNAGFDVRTMDGALHCVRW